MRPLLLLCLLALLAGCAPAPAPRDSGGEGPVATQLSPAPTTAEGPVTITFAVNQYELGSYEPLAQRFMAEHADIAVQVIALPEPATGSDGTFRLDGYQRQVAESADISACRWM
jgi:ABC-type glycerol-3-phosphate transport system substrate-binding protein